MSESVTQTSERPSLAYRSRSTVRLGSLPTDSADDLKFLQQRVSLYGATVAILSGLFLLVGAASHFAVGRDYFQEQARAPHFTGTGIAVLLWLSARTRRLLSQVALQRLDAVATVAMSACFAIMGHMLTPAVGVLISLLAISYVALGRAAQVPSTPKRTLILSGLSFASAFAVTVVSPTPAQYPQDMVGAFFAKLDTLVWCIAGTALATIISRVIYGLQEKVMEARQLGQYTLEEKIGEGGMGAIYRARHAMLRRPTALKLLPGEHSETELRRFEREVQLTASLRHPNTISIFDFGRTPEGTFYYAMELLTGMNLDTLVSKYGPQPAGRVVNILLQTCGALKEAHEVGLIHRDIKPANLYLCRHGGIDDFVKILDFGLVREIAGGAQITQSLTRTLVGTPLYMAPEAIVDPERIDARADLYCLGATAYHLLTGTPPFSGSSVVEVCGHHLHTAPEPLSQRLGKPVPASIEAVVLACLAKDPEDRPASAAVLAERLARADGVAPFTAEDAHRFWEEEARRDDRKHFSPGARTLQVALDARMALTESHREIGSDSETSSIVAKGA